MELQTLLEEFRSVYGDTEGVKAYFAPGRVNLIGEHTDYNGGHVFPCALTMGTYMLARKREDKNLSFYSMNFTKLGVIKSHLDKIDPSSKEGWIEYPKGMMWVFGKNGYNLEHGFDILVYGNIPNGSGLSSSASIELVTGVMLRDMLGIFPEKVDMVELSKWGQYSENNYNGVNCGIMDQFAIAMGKENKAIFLDTATLEYQYVPLVLNEYKIVIISSNKKRGLGDSKYNERRSECEHALSELQKVQDISSLGDLSIEEFEALKGHITSDVERKRAKHAVYENQRTLQAVEALQKNDLITFGRLMNDSHVSLRDDYEVTGIELDTLASAAWDCEGVIGSRMTGAGFGGCTVSLVHQDNVETFIEKVGKKYLDTIGYAADFYVAAVGEGARVLEF